MGRLWNQNIIAFFKSIGFKQLNGDPNILIRQLEGETSIVSIYVDDFLLASNTITTLYAIKKSLAREYNMKDLGEVKTIIGWQMSRDTVAHTIKINQLAFIRDLIIEEELTKCNANIIPMKARSSIEMPNSDDYNKIDIHTY